MERTSGDIIGPVKVRHLELDASPVAHERPAHIIMQYGNAVNNVTPIRSRVLNWMFLLFDVIGTSAYFLLTLFEPPTSEKANSIDTIMSQTFIVSSYVRIFCQIFWAAFAHSDTWINRILVFVQIFACCTSLVMGGTVALQYFQGASKNACLSSALIFTVLLRAFQFVHGIVTSCILKYRRPSPALMYLVDDFPYREGYTALP